MASNWWPLIYRIILHNAESSGISNHHSHSSSSIIAQFAKLSSPTDEQKGGKILQRKEQEKKREKGEQLNWERFIVMFLNSTNHRRVIVFVLSSSGRFVNKRFTAA